jgi:hypothetical protein
VKLVKMRISDVSLEFLEALLNVKELAKVVLNVRERGVLHLF